MKKIIAGGKFGNGNVYIYENREQDNNLIDAQIKKDFKQFCKEFGINKSKLIEDFYKTILIRFRDGTLNVSEGYITINIFRSKKWKKEELELEKV